jgi:hypothetical protein
MADGCDASCGNHHPSHSDVICQGNIGDGPGRRARYRPGCPWSRATPSGRLPASRRGHHRGTRTDPARLAVS